MDFLVCASQVAFFDRALSSTEISAQYAAKNILSSVVPGRGYMALVSSTATCESAAQYGPDRIIGYTSTLEARELITLDKDDLDVVLPHMQNGLFHICFTRDLRTFSTGSDGGIIELSLIHI